MTYTEPLFNQVIRFVTSVGFGFIICILYFALFFIRKAISDKRWTVITQDVVFGVLATVMSFFYMIIYNNGEVRLNLLIGEITGAVVLYCTAGKYINIFLIKAASIIRRTFVVAFLPLKLYFKAFSSFYKKTINGIKGCKKLKQESSDGDTIKKDKKKTGKNKIKKISEKRKNNNLNPLKNQNKSV